MKPIVKALASASVCAILSMPLQAGAQQITFSMSGIVDLGRDDLNLFFGNPGDIVFLGGQTYTMSLTLDAADLDSIHSTPRSASYSGASVGLRGALTMNGKTLTWTTQASSSAVYLELVPELYSPGNRQALSMWTSASRQPGTGDSAIAARHDAVTFDWPLLASTDLDQEISFPEFMRSAVATSRFEASRPGVFQNLTTWFEGRATSATWTVSAVPEPGQYGMLGAGLLALALVRRPPKWTTMAQWRRAHTGKPPRPGWSWA